MRKLWKFLFHRVVLVSLFILLQLAVMLAECFSGWEWNISAVGAEYHVKPLLYKFYGERPADATVLVYTRLVEKIRGCPALPPTVPPGKARASWPAMSG